MACTLVLSPVFEPHFHCNSYGYRLKRSAQDAVICINSFLKQGYIQVDDAGLSKFFDTIPHAIYQRHRNVLCLVGSQRQRSLLCSQVVLFSDRDSVSVKVVRLHSLRDSFITVSS